MDSERGGWMELKALALLVQLELLLLDRFRLCLCFFCLDSSVVLLDADGVMGAAASPFCGGSFALRVLFLCLAMMSIVVVWISIGLLLSLVHSQWLIMIDD